MKKEKNSPIAKKILKIYARLVKSVSMYPTRDHLAQEGISRDTIRQHFVNLSILRSECKKMYPEVFEGIKNSANETTPEALESLDKIIKKHKTFVIATAVAGQWAHRGFLNSIKGYCKKNNAVLLVKPVIDPAHNLDEKFELHFDQALSKELFVFEKTYLNSNIHLSAISINAKQINPNHGLSRFVQGSGSAIFGSPKQFLEYIPTSNTKMPRALMSTGAITLPDYSSTRGNSLRSAFIAEHDHKIGAIIVEIEDDKMYHFRQIQADNDGGFCDLGKYYLNNTVTDITPILVMGDYHAGEHDETAVQAWSEVVSKLNIKEVIVHDLYNGKSINHHEANNAVSLAKRASSNDLSLAKELRAMCGEIEYWTCKKSIERFTIVKSNHDEFLDRRIQEGKFEKDPQNFMLYCELAQAMVDGKDPLKYIIEKAKVKNSNKILWLERNEDYKIQDIELGAHGDKGPNGSKGSIKSMEKSYGKAVIGHSHTPGIFREVFQVGTTSLLKLDYNKSQPSSWVHSSCLVYPNGHRQLINSIQGKWCLKK